MKLVTFQSEGALSTLRKTGILMADQSYINMEKYAIPYDWMVHEMHQKNICPKNGEEYPIWAWAKCGALNAPRKRKNYFGIQQKKLIKITFEKPDNEVLLSDYMAYSFILSGQIVPKNKKEYINFLKRMESQGVSLEDLKNSVRHQKTESSIPINEIQKTWERIFDLKSYIVQACVWNIKMSEVIAIDVLDDKSYIYGAMNAKRSDGSRPVWKKEYFKFRSD